MIFIPVLFLTRKYRLTSIKFGILKSSIGKSSTFPDNLLVLWGLASCHL